AVKTSANVVVKVFMASNFKGSMSVIQLACQTVLGVSLPAHFSHAKGQANR
ncbi:MAG: hypothetical protein ACI9LA_001923, partial [Bacteroidia bacterium]